MIRFKTEEEFINEFGSNWRNLTKYNFTIFMDPLLGTEFIGSIGENYFSNLGGYYSISNDMLTKEYDSPLTELLLTYLQ